MSQPIEMAEAKAISQIHPGRGLGWMSIGASLQGVLSRLKAQPRIYPQIDLSYSSTEPILVPIVVDLPSNGVRLRFDGPTQRLRLIEIVEFSQTTFLYKHIELVRRPSSSEEPTTSGPSFRHIYNRLFGPAYAGEYIPPTSGHSTGTYVLSYPGLAVRFSLKHKSWSEKADFVSLLAAVASPATSIAIFSGSSWPEVRDDLYTRSLTMPRSIAYSSKNNDVVPDEIENVVVHSGGKVELIRRTLSPFTLQLSETIPQDLIAELGPPDAIFRKNSSRLSIQATSRNGNLSQPLPPSSLDTDRSSSHSSAGLDDDSDADIIQDEGKNEEMFYNYFHHGLDILVSRPTQQSPAFPGTEVEERMTKNELVATKVFLHANIPGSYSFNRHRRSRWIIPVPHSSVELTSEMRFTDISTTLKGIWKDHYKSTSEQESFERGMVLNRGWGESPESSIELLGEMEDSTTFPQSTQTGGVGGEGTVLSNTQLFGFPGMLFEVMQGDLVSCVTIY